ncbi:molybdopterin molybdotransferase MoeA [Streptomyces sp. NPDC058067]|uniref:molybdopterin molybdotransferase MoeA n=1 Tax=Streptomyces sp. NPDC058067 TaxID=3346324 RepID=UPI0036F111E3
MSGQSAESLAAQARAAEDSAVDEALALVNEGRRAGAFGAGRPGGGRPREARGASEHHPLQPLQAEAATPAGSSDRPGRPSADDTDSSDFLDQWDPTDRQDETAPADRPGREARPGDAHGTGPAHAPGDAHGTGPAHAPGDAHGTGPAHAPGPAHNTGPAHSTAPAHDTSPECQAVRTAPVERPRRRAVAWAAARAVAQRAGRDAAALRGRTAERRVPLDLALGLTLAEPLVALCDLPSFDTSAMDGWVVAGPGPWDVRAEGILAGQDGPEPLSDGEAVRIATGARVPREATAVIRSEHGRTDAKGRLFPLRDVGHGQDIRPRGQECRSGDQLLPPGALVTPAVLGLAAAAGYDELPTVARPRAEVFVLGDELLTTGLPRDGLIRDALGPMLPHWLRALGAEVVSVRRLGDDPKALLKAVRSSDADLVVTTGGTASGPVDHVHPTLSRIDADLLVDGVAVRPGHPMLLARTKQGQYLVGLPGNPLAAVSGLLTLAEPLLRVLAGRPVHEAYTAPLRSAVHGHPHDTRLVPVALRGDEAVPLHYNGPAMLRGVAAADGLAVVAPGGARAGQELEILDLPWSWNPSGSDVAHGYGQDSAGKGSGKGNGKGGAAEGCFT